MYPHQFLASKQQFANLAVLGEPDEIIKGRYGEVTCYRVASEKNSSQRSNKGFSSCNSTKKPTTQSSTASHSDPEQSDQSNYTKWFFVPRYLPVGRTFTSDSDEEWIANSVSNLPNVDFFVNFTSFDQVKHWVSFRDYAVKFAFCFWSDGDSPWLKSELEEGQIDDFSYNYSLAVAKIFKNLWSLIKTDESEFKRIFTKNWGFPFDSGRALFVEIVREDLEEEFLVCLKSRYIYNASHIKRIAVLKRKVHQAGSLDEETKELNRLIGRTRPALPDLG